MSWIIFANARKRKARVLMTVLGIAIGVATLFALLSLSAGIEKALDREIGGMGAHILLLPEGCPYELTLALMQGSDAFEHIPAELLAEIQAVDNVDLAVPVVVGKAKVNGQLTSIYGTTSQILKVRQWGIDAFEGVILGSDVAEKLGLSVGDPITISLYSTVEAHVSQVLETTHGRDDTFVFVAMDVAQQVLGLVDRFSAILIRTTIVTESTRTQYTLGRMSDIQAVPPSDIFERLMELFASIKQTLILITGIAIVAGVMTTMNTMTMAVFERKKEIGILQALGSTKLNVFKLFVTESLLLSLVGGVVGLIAGYIATLFLPKTSGFGLEATPQFEPIYVVICLVVAVIVGVASSLYPAMSAARTQPIKTLREL
ncbi:ABC transporter permease [Candidatus Bipolaricaulota bacterium]|nr:ABC transporter permease [Candidatus Bipolaricaulota bacterium]